MHSTFKAALAVTAAACALSANAAWAASVTFTTPNVVTTAGATQVTLGGQTFINQGLQGMARIPAGTKDFLGSTFGAFSGLDLDLSAWRKTATGYTGTLFALPDRGPNGIGTVSFSDYAGRLSTFTLAFTPYTGTANLPASVTSQNQMVLTANGGIVLKDFNGNLTTGLDPGARSTITQNGITLPGSATGPAAGKISLDAEAVRFLADKSFYVSDEYGANVYYFNQTGQLQGVIKPPPALIPRDADLTVNYTSTADEALGRRFNQGLEGMAVTPDGKKLVTLLQSATYQDTNGTNQPTRNNTRLMIYDISGTKTPTTPIADYVLQLPVYTLAGNGAAANRLAAQSELLALNDTQFLVLARDGLGLGQTTGNSVIKSIYLVDTTGATNIAGSVYETTYTPLATNGTLVPSITPVQQVELVNMLNSTQLAKFGENLNNVTPTRLTLGEKWEGMALAPVLEENAPQDFFLFVGNDNDFLATNCNVNGQDCSQAVDSDAHVLIYRLTLPTYVDAQYLGAMNAAGPTMVELASQAAATIGATTTTNVLGQLNSQRQLSAARTEGGNAWVTGGYASNDWDSFFGGPAAKSNGFRGTVGVDYQVAPAFTAGVAVSYGGQKADVSGGGLELDADGYSVGGNLSYATGGFYAEAGYSIGHVDINRIARAGAYGLTGLGNTGGMTNSYFVEGGYNFEVGPVGDGMLKAGPVVGYTGARTRLNGYTETGAAGGNIVVPRNTLKSSVVVVGGEAFVDLPRGDGALTPYVRVTYNAEMETDPRNVALRLASAQNAMGTATMVVPTVNEDAVEAGAGIAGRVGHIGWRVGYSAQLGLKERTSHIVQAGLSLAF